MSRRTTAARRLQTCLARRVRPRGGPRRVRRLAGLDCAFPDHGTTARGVAVLMDWPALTVLETAVVEHPVGFPYVPGLLAFRELPVMLAAFRALSVSADLVLCDGQGLAHPRRLGVASHFGLITGISSIGVGKSRLVGEYTEPGPEKGARTPLLDDGDRIGTVLRSRRAVRPLFVSPGHAIDHDRSAAWVLACCPRYRVPEPIRAADRLAGARTGAINR